MAVGAEARQLRDVGCPFCGLLCDDLGVDAAAGRLRVTAAGCRRSRDGFERIHETLAPMVDGRSVDLPQAVARAADVLSKSHAPVFSVAADVAGARAALRLADRLGGVVDHPGSDALFRNLRVLQDAGAFTTTLGEIRNRADLVLIVGPDPSSAFPRFIERSLSARQTLFSKEPLERQVIRLAPPAGPGEPVPDGVAVTELACAAERLPEAVAMLAALLRNRAIAKSDIPHFDREELGALARRMKAARYAVVAWAPAMLEPADGELVALALLEIVRELNRTTRAAALPLAGTANLLGVNQVCAWQTGYPLRTAFAAGGPDHDPYRFSARRMIEQGEADALVSVMAFGDEPLPAPGQVPTILLASPAVRPARPVAAYIPVGVPGIDHAGQLFRADTVVSLRLPALRKSSLPNAASVIAEIEARLANGDRVS